MKLVKLTLSNWGPFKGTQELDLSTSAQAPVVLVHGENMRGKTSLMRALRFVLYGVVYAHDGTEIPDADFANYDLRDAGEPFEYGAKLRFEWRGKEIELERLLTGLPDGDLTGAKLKVVRQPARMKVIGGDPFPERDIDEQVQRILHPEISDFFLFDGEMLARFEERLRGDTSSSFVRTRIEMALGVPALRLLRSDVTYLAEETSAEVRRHAKAEKDAKGYGQQLTEVEEEIARAEADLDALKEEEARTAQDVKRLADQLAKVESIKEAFYKRQAAEESRASYIADRDGAVAELKQQLERAWWLPLHDKLQCLARRAEQDLQDAFDATSGVREIENALKSARKQLGDPVCRTCGQQMPDSGHAEVRARIEELERELADSPDLPDTADLAARVKSLRPYLVADQVLDRVQGIEKDIRRAGLRADGEQSAIDDLTGVLEDDDLDIALLDKQYDEARLTLRQAKDYIDEVGKDLAGFKKKRADLTRRLAESTPSAKGPGARLQVLEEMQETVEGAIGIFRESMRHRIQAEASEIFRQLTTEDEYAGLRIDGGYYLNIVDDRDRVIARRSAGADQVVTMSLIGALARCSVEDGPIVMDTPFGRLDKGHRRKILQWVAALGGQAVLFVQSGEFERERDLPALEGKVGREYLLRRLGATSTRIEAVTHD